MTAAEDAGAYRRAAASVRKAAAELGKARTALANTDDELWEQLRGLTYDVEQVGATVGTRMDNAVRRMPPAEGVAR